MGSLNCDLCDLVISRIERGRESEFPPTRIAISGQRSERVVNRSSVLQKMALGVVNRSSVLQKMALGVVNRSSLLQRLLRRARGAFLLLLILFLMGYAFFWQETASFCNFKLTMGVI